MKKHFSLLATFALASATFSCSSDYYLECYAKQVKCENGKIFVCTAKEVWSTKSKPCESGICENAVKCQTPIIDCTPNEKLCKANVHYECNDTGDAWATLNCTNFNTFCLAEKACVECMVIGDCPSGSIDCKDNKCVKKEEFVCTDGASKCLDKMLYTCTNNAWGIGVACDTDHECKDGNVQCTAIESVTCTNDDTKCEDNKLVICVDEAWNTPVACDAGHECLNGAKTCTAISCVDGATKCLDEMLHTCTDNDWGDGVTCDTGDECKDGADTCTAIF